jgi:cyclase
MNRRQWIAAAAGIATFPGAMSLLRAQSAAEEIAPGFTIIRGPGGNSLVGQTSAGTVLVDSGSDPGSALAGALTDLAGNADVHTLFNTHWHTDQTAGNAVFGAAGARIVAHAKTRQRLAAGYYLRDEERYAPSVPSDAVPTDTFFDTEAFNVGDAVIECGHLLEAHTDGDIYVRFPQANVIAAGDAISPLVDPMLDWFGGGWIGGRLDALSLLLELSDAQTRFVPSYGPAVGRDYVEQELALMTTIFDRMVEFIRQGMSAEDCIEAGVVADLDRQFDDPSVFIDATHRSLWAHHNKLSHDIV